MRPYLSVTLQAPIVSILGQGLPPLPPLSPWSRVTGQPHDPSNRRRFLPKAQGFSQLQIRSLLTEPYRKNLNIMKKLGLGKKKDDGDQDKQRSALFGGRSKNKSPNPQTSNPYANLPTQGDAYNAAKAKAGVPGYAQRGPSPAPPPAQQSGYGGYPDEKRGGYGGMNGGYPDEKKSGGYGGVQDNSSRNGGGYGPDRYGAQSGYGADKYGGGSEGGGSRYGPGGYGGLGSASNAPDENRDALFGGARERVEKQSNQQMGYGQPPPYEEGQPGDQQGGYGGGGGGGPSYQAYGDRQLTAEEEEEEDVQATKQQIRFIKQEDVSSTRNALRIAAQAEETG